jgi:hypothetical protein
MNKKLIGIAFVIALLIGIYLYSQYNPEDYALFPKCPVYTITGIKCPGCGSQRAFHSLFQGHFIAAFLYNPLMFLIMPYIFLGIFVEYIANRNNPRIVYIRNIFFNKWVFLIIAAIIVLYTILRNVY